MVILFTALSSSTAGEVLSTALYCKHWSYSPGELSELRLAQLVSTLSDLSRGPTHKEYAIQKCAWNLRTLGYQLTTAPIGCWDKLCVDINTASIGWFSIIISCPRLENRWLRSRHISVHVCMTSMMIADYDRLKLSTPEYLLFSSAKQYLLGIKMYL